MTIHILLAGLIGLAVPIYILLMIPADKRNVSVPYLIYSYLTFKAARDRWVAAYRRKRYDALKALVVDEHLKGFGGAVIPKKYKMKEVGTYFKPPMYHMARNGYNQLCLFWRKDLMDEEVGPPLAERSLKPETATGSTDGVH